MAKQHTNPKAIVAAASGYSTSPWGVTFYGPMGHITLNDDGTFITGGWASCLDTGGYKDPRVLAGLQQAYRAHPALTGNLCLLLWSKLTTSRLIARVVRTGEHGKSAR